MDLTEVTGTTSHRHPWEISRARSIVGLLEELKFETVADIGSGDLYFAKKVNAFTGKEIYACDINYDQKALIEEDGIITVSDIAEIPKGTIDLIFLLDVLEHVEDESQFLQEVVSLLSPDGRIIITVPAFQFLFGEHDIFLKHFRRYRKKQMETLLNRNHLAVVKGFYFYSSLFIIKLIQKYVSFAGIQKQYKNSVSKWQFSRKHIVTRFFSFLLNVDFSTNKFFHSSFNITMPGLSVCLIVKKHA